MNYARLLVNTTAIVYCLIYEGLESFSSRRFGRFERIQWLHGQQRFIKWSDTSWNMTGRKIWGLSLHHQMARDNTESRRLRRKVCDACFIANHLLYILYLIMLQILYCSKNFHAAPYNYEWIELVTQLPWLLLARNGRRRWLLFDDKGPSGGGGRWTAPTQYIVAEAVATAAVAVPGPWWIYRNPLSRRRSAWLCVCRVGLNYVLFASVSTR